MRYDGESQLAEEGDWLDLGTGLPTANNTHEVAQSIAPDSRIVYVDSDRSCSRTPARC